MHQPTEKETTSLLGDLPQRAERRVRLAQEEAELACTRALKLEDELKGQQEVHQAHLTTIKSQRMQLKLKELRIFALQWANDLLSKKHGPLCTAVALAKEIKEEELKILQNDAARERKHREALEREMRVIMEGVRDTTEAETSTELEPEDEGGEESAERRHMNSRKRRVLKNKRKREETLGPK